MTACSISRTIRFITLFLCSVPFLGMAYGNGGSVYDFSTPATLIQGNNWYDKARITVDGVEYEIGTVMNGDLQNVSSGGHNNSAALHQSTATGGLNFNIKRTDGGSFQFYGLWLKYTSTSWAESPFLRIRFYDENNHEISSESHVNNSRNSTSNISRDVRVSRVHVYFSGVLDWWLDNIHVGPPMISAPVVATGTSVNAGDTFATVNGEVLETGGGEISERGFYWSEVPDLATATQVTAGSGGGGFQAVLSALSPETEYHVWAYATNEADTAVGDRVSFETTDGTGPVVVFPELAINHDNDAWLVVDPTSHYVGALEGFLPAESAMRFSPPALESSEISEVALRLYVSAQEGNAFAHVWGSFDDSWDASEARSPSLDVELSDEVPVNETGVWLEFDVTDFVAGRLAGGNDASFVILGETGAGTHEFVYTGTGSSNEANWPRLVITRSLTSDNADLASLSITPGELNETFFPETTTYSATVPYEVDSVSVTAEPDDEENGVAVVEGAEAFDVGLNALTVTVTAEDGSTKTYTINVTRLPMLPEVSTAAADLVTDGSALLGGVVDSDGEGQVSAAGIVWALNEAPDSGDHSVSLGSGIGAFEGVLTGFPPATRVYFRAYAVNEAGIAYGEQQFFDTLSRELVITGSFTAADKIYDGTGSALIEMSSMGLFDVHPTHDVALAGLMVAFDGPAAGPAQTVRVVEAGLDGPDAGRYTLTLENAPVAAAEIAPRPLTLSNFTVDDKTYDGTTDVTGVAFDDDRLAGDELEFGFDAAFIDADIGEDKPVDIFNISIIGGTDQGNYALMTTSGQATATITPGVPESLVLAKQPESVVAGQTIPAPELTLFDAHDFPVQAGFAVTVSLSAGEFTEGSTTRVLTDDRGRVSFDNLVVLQAGEGYTLTFQIEEVE